MTKCQSSQNRFVQAALTAVALAFALTALPGTALADALPEDQQQIAPVEETGAPAAQGQEMSVVEESDGQNTPVVEDQVDNDNDQAIDTTVDQEIAGFDAEQKPMVDLPATDDTNDVQTPDNSVVTDDTTPTDGDVATDEETAGEVASLTLDSAPILRAPAPGEEGTGEGEETDPEPTTIPEEYALSGNTYYIGSGMDNTTAAKFLDVAGGKVANGTNVQVYTYNGSNAQKWEFLWDAVNGAYSIYLGGTDRAYALDLSGANASNKRNIQIYTANGTKAQLWVLLQQVSGAYTISSFVDPSYVLDIAGGKYVNSTNVQLYSGNGSKAQSFYLVDTTVGLSTTPETEGLSGDTYLIQTSMNGVTSAQVLDVKGGKVANSSNVQTYSYNNTSAQKWDFRWDAVNGAYVIGTHGSNFSYVLDVSGGTAANSRNIQIYKANGSAAQLWHVTKVGDTYKLASYVDPNFVIDIAGGKYANSTNVQLYTGNGTPAQSFYLVDTTPVVEGEAAADRGKWQGAWTASSNKDNAFALDISGGSYANSANVQLYKGNGTAAQRLYLEPTGDGYYIITVIGTGKVLDVAGGKVLPGSNVQQYTRNNSNAQKWAVKVIDEANNIVTFVNKGTGLVLDVSGGKMANSTNIQGYSSNGTAAQQFVLAETPFLTDGIYEIRSYKKTDSVIDIKSGSASAGAGAQLYADNNSLAQRFQVVTVGNNQYIIRTAASGGYLMGHDRAQQVTQEGSKAAMDAAEFTPDVWQAVWNGSFFSLQNSTTLRVLDLKGGSVANGTALQTYEANKSAAQYFLFAPVTLVNAGLYEIHSGISTKYGLDISGGSTKPGANVQLYTDNNSAAQLFRLEKSGSGFRIVSSKSGLAVTGGTADKDNVTQETATGASNQVWIPVIADGGFITFQNEANKNMVLDVSGGKAANSQNVQVYSSNNSNAQKWKLEPVKTGWSTVNGKRYYRRSDGNMVQFSDAGYAAWKGVQRFTSPTKYIMVIDNSNYRTFVFTGSKGNWEPLYDWLATVGTSPENGGDETFGETYRGENGYVDRKGYMMGEYPYEFYWTEFYLNNAAREANPENPEGQRFHSILYRDRNHTQVYDDTLGAAASHGCVRLALDNAKWVYDNIPKGTRVWSY